MSSIIGLLENQRGNLEVTLYEDTNYNDYREPGAKSGPKNWV